MARFSRIALLVGALLMLATSIAGQSLSDCEANVNGLATTNGVTTRPCCPKNQGCYGATMITVNTQIRCICEGCDAACEVFQVNSNSSYVTILDKSSSGGSTLWFQGPASLPSQSLALSLSRNFYRKHRSKSVETLKGTSCSPTFFTSSDFLGFISIQYSM